MDFRRLSTFRFAPLLMLAAVMVVIPLATSSNYWLRIGALVWVMALAAVGLQLLMGLAGQISLGHAGFFGVGAYAMAVLPTRFGFPPLLAALAGVAVSGLIAFFIGKPILRLKGHSLAIATLGLSLLIALIISSEVAVTGGPDGINVPRLVVFEHTVVSPAAWYWIGAALLLLGVALAIQLRASPSGRALRSILDSEVAAASMGVDVARRKLQVFVIAAMYGAVSGAALALMNGFITPDVASFMSSVEFVAMVVLGGLATPFGAVIGAALLTLLPQVLASFNDYQDMAVGLIIMLSMIFLRQGIVPTLSHALARRKR